MFFSKRMMCVGFAVLIGTGGMIASAATLPSLHSVLKVVAYQEQKLMPDTYQEYSYGSAIALSSTRLLTNAHVILDENFKPIDYLAVCMTDDAFVVPKCVTTATVIAYDVDKDIALLELSEPADIVPVEMNAEKLSLNDYVQVLGYPSNGGGTITLTQGRISGKDSERYKIDANLDGGNSGGGAFDEHGTLIGIPVSVRHGYTTLGYMIPIAIVQDFIAKKENFAHTSAIDTKAFADFIVGVHRAKQLSSISNEFFNFDGFGQYGYQVQESTVAPTLGTYEYVLASSDKKTTITVGISPYVQAQGDKGDDVEELLKQARKIRKNVVLRENVSFMDKTWTVVFLDGYKGSDKPDKALSLIYDDGSFFYEYTINTEAESTQQFNNALRALVYGYIINQHNKKVDLRTFGELLLPDTLTLSSPTPTEQGVKMTTSYGDAVGGNISYNVIEKGGIDTEKPNVTDMCKWIDDDKQCKSLRITNARDITMHITTFINQDDDKKSHIYSVDIADAHEDMYVNYKLFLSVDDGEHHQRVKDFIQNIGGDVQRIYETKPEIQSMP